MSGQGPTYDVNYMRLPPAEPPMPREPIQTPHAPAAIGPYSQATRAGDLVFLSGQIPLDPASGLIVEGDITAQAQQAFANLRAVC